MIFVALTFAIPLGFVAFGSNGCDGDVSGEIVVAGARGNFRFTPTGCGSMQPFGRFGARLHASGPHDGGVYVATDPVHGASVDVEVPGSCRNSNGTDCTVFSVPRDRCTTFSVQVEPTGVVLNDIRLVEGHLRVDCTLEDGTTVRGSIQFDDC